MDRVDEMLAAWQAEQPGLDTLPLQLSKRIGRLAALSMTATERALDGFGVTYAEFDVLATLRRAGAPYRLKPGRLAEDSMLTTGGTSNIVQRLVAAGLVERERDPHDGRSSWVRLTERGVHTAERIVEATTRAQRSLFDGVPEPTARALTDLLRQALLALGDRARGS